MTGGQDVRAGTSITERLVAALTATWRAIQDRHYPDVPDVVLTLGSGTLGARRGEVTLGHFAAGRWHTTEPTTTEPEQDDHADDNGDDEAGDSGPEDAADPGMAELFVGGEGLRRGARDVLGTLLHEAAHGAATTRGIKDTSRQGRYHNRRFAELGAELGITVAIDGARGWSSTTLPDETADDYAGELAQLGEAITAYRRAETGGSTTTTSRNNPPALCGCEPPRRIRVARAVLAAGPIVCGCCGTEFTVDDPDPDPDGEEDRVSTGERIGGRAGAVVAVVALPDGMAWWPADRGRGREVTEARPGSVRAGRPVGQVAREFGASERTAHRWAAAPHPRAQVLQATG